MWRSSLMLLLMDSSPTSSALLLSMLYAPLGLTLHAICHSLRKFWEWRRWEIGGPKSGSPLLWTGRRTLSWRVRKTCSPGKASGGRGPQGMLDWIVECVSCIPLYCTTKVQLLVVSSSRLFQPFPNQPLETTAPKRPLCNFLCIDLVSVTTSDKLPKDHQQRAQTAQNSPHQ